MNGKENNRQIQSEQEVLLFMKPQFSPERHKLHHRRNFIDFWGMPLWGTHKDNSGNNPERGKLCRGFPCSKSRAARIVADWGTETSGLVKVGLVYAIDCIWWMLGKFCVGYEGYRGDVST